MATSDYLPNTNLRLRAFRLGFCNDPRVDEGKAIIAFHFHEGDVWADEPSSRHPRWLPVMAHGVCCGCLAEASSSHGLTNVWTVLERPDDFDPTDDANRWCGSLHCVICRPDGPGDQPCDDPGCWECDDGTEVPTALTLAPVD